jgi:membrane protein implicated in regulation of membrane protease activity
VFSFETLYLGCFAVGVAYAVIVGFFAGILGGDHDFGGALDIDVGGDIGDLDAGDFSGSLQFSPLSPWIIAVFLGMFGGSGYCYMALFGIDGKISIIPALATAIIVAVAVFLVMDYVFRNVQGGVESSAASLIGREAEVITDIPSDGMGEIAVVSSGGRTNVPARSATGAPISKTQIVKIQRIIGNIYLVEPSGSAEKAEKEKPQPDLQGIE